MNFCPKRAQALLLLLTSWLCLLSIGCLALTENQQPRSGFTEHYNSSVQEYLDLAANAQPPEKQAYQLKAAGRLIQDKQLVEANNLLTNIDIQRLDSELSNEKILLTANLQLAHHQFQQALIELNTIEQPANLTAAQQLAYYQSLSRANRQVGDYLLSAEAAMAMEPLLPDGYKKQHNQQRIWSDLNQLSTDSLSSQIRHVGYGQLQGWLEATYINKQYSSDPELLQQALVQWQQRYPQHPAQELLPTIYQHTKFERHLASTSNDATTTPYQRRQKPLNVALLLPSSGKLSSSSQAIRNGFMAAYYSSNKQYTPQSIKIYNTAENSVKTLYKQAIADGANLVIGPLTKDNVVAIKKLGNLAVPTIALNYTDTTTKANKNLYEYALSPQDEARQVAQKARSDGYSHALVIAPAGSWGEGIANQYIQRWETTGATITEKLFYTNQTNFNYAIKNLLQVNKSDSRKQNLNKILGERVKATPQKRTDVDVIFLVASPSKARQIIPLLKFHYAGDIPIYSTSMIYSGKPNPLQDKDLNGVTFCEMPWLIDNNDRQIEQKHKKMQLLMPNTNPQSSRLYAFGIDAYQLAMQLYYRGLIANSNIDGVTGQLYLGEPQQQIYRRLPWARFKNGVPKQVSIPIGTRSGGE